MCSTIPKKLLVRLRAVARAQQTKQHRGGAALGKRRATVLGHLRGHLEELEGLEDLANLLAGLQRVQRGLRALAEAQAGVGARLLLGQADALPHGGHLRGALDAHAHRAV